MKLKAIYKTQDEIPEQYRDLYTERNDQWELTGVEGIKTQADVERVQQGAAQERTDHAETKAKLKVYTDAFGDRDVKEINADLDRIPELEAKATGEIDQEKIDTLVDARVKRETAPLQRQIDDLTKTNGELTTENEGFKAANTKRSIHDVLRKAGTDAKMQPQAMDDLLMYSGEFELDADGVPVTKADSILGAGMMADAFVTGMKEKRPHWWGPSEGGGAGGNLGGANTGDNPFSHKNWNLTKQGELINKDRAKAEQLAKQAGTTIGGPRPAAPAAT
jgi:hypothetical protein